MSIIGHLPCPCNLPVLPTGVHISCEGNMLFKADTMVPLYWLTIASQLAVLDAHSVLYVLAAVPVLYMCYVFSNC